MHLRFFVLALAPATCTHGVATSVEAETPESLNLFASYLLALQPIAFEHRPSLSSDGDVVPQLAIAARKRLSRRLLLMDGYDDELFDGIDEDEELEMELRKLGETPEGAKHTAAKPEAAPSPLDLPEDAVIGIAGAATPLGQLTSRALAHGDRTVVELSSTDSDENFQDVDAVIIITETAGGKGGIDSSEVPKLLAKLDDPRRLVLASVRGVSDTSVFNPANLFGQLDKQRFAEEELILYAEAQQLQNSYGDESDIPFPGFTIIRFGKLIDDSEQAVVSDIAGPPKTRDELVLGDKSEGDTLLSTAAAVLIEALKQPTGSTFSLGKPDAKAGLVSDDQLYWDDQFLRCVGPEIFRKPFTEPQTSMVTKLRNWVSKYQDGKGLTSPAVVSDVENGALLQFQVRDTKEPDGALLFLAEAEPSPRIRVVRTMMDVLDDIAVKTMSEEVLLGDLENNFLRGR